MTNGSGLARPLLTSLSARSSHASAYRPVAAMGRFYYPRPPLWPALASGALHLVVAVILVWTARSAMAHYAMDSASFLPPPQRYSAARGAGAGMLAMVTLPFHTGSAGTDGGTREQNGAATRRRGAGVVPKNVLAIGDTVAEVADNVYTVFQVDNAAQISTGSVVPRYPPDLLARRIGGKVTVRFVVDTLGTADVTSIEILDASAPQFEESVRAALPHMRFSPARLNGRRVRQLVEQPFRFNVTQPPVTADSTG